MDPALVAFLMRIISRTFNTKLLTGILLIQCALCHFVVGQVESANWHSVFHGLILADGDEETFVKDLEVFGDPGISDLYEAWRTGDVYSFEQDREKIALRQMSSSSWIKISTGEAIELSSSDLESMSKLRPSRGVRRMMKSLIDTLGLKAEDPIVRQESAMKLGLSQNSEFLPALRSRLEIETNKNVQTSIHEALAISLLANGSPEEILQSVETLGDLKSVPGRDFVQKIYDTEIESDRSESTLSQASINTISKIEAYIGRVEFIGNFFRGLSLGSVLLIVSFGLAITFGLMGIINMAHGEFVAIGGYTTYLVQTWFISIWGIDSYAFGWYFVISLPISFAVAAVIGLGLEKSVIRFLYRRPLESLLCTWGLSMIMQQGFRLIFGAANVQVNNPAWLLGNLSVGGFNMSYTRLFIMAIAVVVVILTWLLLRKTNLGLHIRAVMQNRDMASSLGIPVNKVNSMTFALGCGLAAVGGSVLSQIGNVGPSMGQAYIVDCFMVVVIGSVGNLLGAGISAMGIGSIDQFLQPSLGPVMGKITVFFLIIIFLQWRPGGLFPTRSRSLED
ncbi:urea ABC transporter permease subunit UrtB [Opitutales bacterium]|nr:urea ABC transporter permease subunit UrtB [Opitutales bacterium]